MGKYILIKLGSYIIFYCQAYLRHKLNFFNQIMIRQKTLLKLSSYVASISRHYFGKAWIIWNNSNFSVFVKENSSFSFPSLSKCCPTKFKHLSEKLEKKTYILSIFILLLNQTLRKKCPNTELFLVRIFLYSVQIQENADQK